MHPWIWTCDSSSAATLLSTRDPACGMFRANFEQAKVDVFCEVSLSRKGLGLHFSWTI